MPPRAQTGPLTPIAGSSISPMDLGKFGSIVFPAFLSVMTRRPEGQSRVSSMATCLFFGSSDFGTRFQMPSARWQKRAEAHKFSVSSSFNVGPSISLGWLR